MNGNVNGNAVPCDRHESKRHSFDRSFTKESAARRKVKGPFPQRAEILQGSLRMLEESASTVPNVSLRLDRRGLNRVNRVRNYKLSAAYREKSDPLLLSQ